ncbi:hypothetical protein ACTL32_08765 [Planococcus sp. FY231025]|uniref:Uncharacterized protein n=1 Tax=Planococcus chinensis TaxID=272917 RepID=A0ABW4QKP5_9BACL
MNSVRITKYDPQNRDANGHYTLVDEWTSISDVGKSFQGKILTMEQYLAIEGKYIQAVEMLLQKNGSSDIAIVDLENHTDETAMDLSEGKTISHNLVSDLVKLILREKVWGRLVANNQFEIHFGYDYYMYFVGESLTDDIIEELRIINGLYVEEVRSPYLEE